MIKPFWGNTRRHWNEFIKYAVASTAALAVDFGSYWFLATHQVVEIPQAAVAGYGLGLIVAYLLIADNVFKDGWLRDKKLFEGSLFAISGLLGIALTYGTVSFFILIFGEQIGYAKITAVAISFLGVYVFRKLFVFKPATRANKILSE